MLTQNEFQNYKKDYSVYGKQTVTDEYGNERYIYDEVTASIHVMWHPVTDAAAIAEYGERVRSMKQCVLYEQAQVEPFDRIIIDSVPYTVIEVMPYNTHRFIRVEKV